MLHRPTFNESKIYHNIIINDRREMITVKFDCFNIKLNNIISFDKSIIIGVTY